MRRRQYIAALTQAHGTEALDGATISREVAFLHDRDVATQKARYDIAPIAHKETTPAPVKGQCGKCGRVLTRGLTMHTRHCKGAR